MSGSESEWERKGGVGREWERKGGLEGSAIGNEWE